MVFEPHQAQRMATGTSDVSNGNAFFQQQEGGFLGISSSHTGGGVQRSGAFIHNSNQHQASVVR